MLDTIRYGSGATGRRHESSGKNACVPLVRVTTKPWKVELSSGPIEAVFGNSSKHDDKEEEAVSLLLEMVDAGLTARGSIRYVDAAPATTASTTIETTTTLVLAFKRTLPPIGVK
jgi:hypothetical protein